MVLAISVGLLAGSTVGAAAQSEAVEPVGFTGQLHEYGGECAGTYEVIDGVRRLPTHVRRRLLSQFRTMVRSESTRKSPTARYEREWSLMTSPN